MGWNQIQKGDFGRSKFELKSYDKSKDKRGGTSGRKPDFGRGGGEPFVSLAQEVMGKDEIITNPGKRDRTNHVKKYGCKKHETLFKKKFWVRRKKRSAVLTG